MQPLIYNRDGDLGEDGWILIVPRGELPNKEAGIVQVLDDKALKSIYNNLQADRASDSYPGLYFGVEHHIYDPSKSSEAMGWAKEFRLESDGIRARPELTDIGREAIDNRRFKFTSFVVDPKNIERLDGNRVRPLRIETVGFTNLPNSANLQPAKNRSPISNRAEAISQRAIQLQRDNPPLSLSSAYLRAQREILASRDIKQIANRAEELQQRLPYLSLAGAWTMAASQSKAKTDPVQFASEAIMDLASKSKGTNFAQSFRLVCNRFPQLMRMVNREKGWDALSDLEPVARENFLQAIKMGRGDASPTWRWSKILDAITDQAIQHPDFGSEQLLDQYKANQPQQYWRLVLSSAPGGSEDPKEPFLYSKSNPSAEAQAWLDAVAAEREKRFKGATRSKAQAQAGGLANAQGS